MRHYNYCTLEMARYCLLLLALAWWNLPVCLHAVNPARLLAQAQIPGLTSGCFASVRGIARSLPSSEVAEPLWLHQAGPTRIECPALPSQRQEFLNCIREYQIVTTENCTVTMIPRTDGCPSGSGTFQNNQCCYYDLDRVQGKVCSECSAGDYQFDVAMNDGTHVWFHTGALPTIVHFEFADGLRVDQTACYGLYVLGESFTNPLAAGSVITEGNICTAGTKQLHFQAASNPLGLCSKELYSCLVSENMTLDMGNDCTGTMTSTTCPDMSFAMQAGFLGNPSPNGGMTPFLSGSMANGTTGSVLLNSTDVGNSTIMLSITPAGASAGYCSISFVSYDSTRSILEISNSGAHGGPPPSPGPPGPPPTPTPPPSPPAPPPQPGSGGDLVMHIKYAPGLLFALAAAWMLAFF